MQNKIVRCVECAAEDHLTVGQVYPVLAVDDAIQGSGEDYILAGDDGKPDRFMAELFEAHTPDCSYCDQPITGPFERYGGAFLHPACYRQLGEDLAEIEDTFEPGDN